MNKDNIKLIELLNPTAFNLSMAGIGFKDGYDDYILVVFEDKTMKFNKTYKSLKNAKIGFAKIYKKKAILPGKKPVWNIFPYCCSIVNEKKKKSK